MQSSGYVVVNGQEFKLAPKSEAGSSLSTLTKGEVKASSSPMGLSDSSSSAPQTKALTIRQNGKILTRNKRSKGMKGAKSRGRKAAKVPNLPPEIDAVVTCSHVFRFRVANGSVSNEQITYANVAGALGGICTVANSTVVAWASSIRIRKIVLWPGAISGAANTCEWVWGSPNYAPTKDAERVSILPDGMTVDKAIVTVPPSNSVLGDWFTPTSLGSGTASVIGALTAYQGTILDLHVSWTLGNNIGGVTITNFTTSALGSIYYLALDGRATNKLVPIGVPTTS